ncbi:MAG: GerW family sporulation protein [Clostridia bacterium]|nr:GerW family sporulation protein [Clostridia bacterium]
MNEHPIEGLMNTAMSNLKDMIDVDTVVGEAIDCGNGTTIIPVSKVCFGFAAGGSEFKGETVDQYSKEGSDEDITYRLPFGGGSGAGVCISPIGFLVVSDSNVKMIPVDHCSSLDKLLDYVPDVLEKISEFWDRETVYEYEFYDEPSEEAENE